MLIWLIDTWPLSIEVQMLATGKSISLVRGALAGTGSNFKYVEIRLDEYQLLAVESQHKVGYD